MVSLQPEHVVALVDSREQLPLKLEPLAVEVTTLQTGDYSVAGLQDLVAVERKSLQDLVQCVGRERERFQRELDRLRAYPVRLLVVEAEWSQIERREYRGSVSPQSVIGSLLAWQSRGLPTMLVGDHERASLYVSRFLYLAARTEFQRLQKMCDRMSDFAQPLRHVKPLQPGEST